MIVRHLLLAILPVAVWLSCPGLAHADYAEAEKAAANNDFAAARKALEPLQKGDDARVFKLLGELNRDGKGAAPNMVAAYRDFSLFGMYTEDPGERATAFAMRRDVSRRMKDRVAEIPAAESQVIEQVDDHLGGPERRAQVRAIRKDLSACKKNCDVIAVKLYRFGPAASEAVPELEAVLTRDPYWMPRESYVYALAYIGTEGVPALARVFLDEKEMASEGFWNAQQASAALRSLGPTAYKALPILAQAMTRTFEGLGGEELGISEDLAQGVEELVFGLKVGIAQAALSIGDPRKEIHDQLTSYFTRETALDVKLLTGWLIGLLYEEPEQALALVDQNISSTVAKVVQMCLVIIGDFHKLKAAQPQIEALLPKVKQVADHGPEGTRELAADLLSHLGK